MQATINQEIQLLVEGRSTQVFIAALLQHLKLTNKEVPGRTGAPIKPDTSWYVTLC